VIKKGQLRRWKNPRDGGIFMTIGCRIVKDGTHWRRELVWGAACRGTKVWSILEDGRLTEETHIDLEQHTEPIDEAR
jgi:hypothetical protein